MAETWSARQLDNAVTSLQSLGAGNLDAAALRELLAVSAHLSHKDWSRTEGAAAALAKILGGPDDASFQKLFQRVLVDGNWEGAIGASEAAVAKGAGKPWVVLVTGLNGIRKTTSTYQPWFCEVLKQALGESFSGVAEELPCGSNSFFRQLDYMLVTLAHEDFKRLYSVEDVAPYAEQKAAIFAEYRTYAEMLGVLLIKEARWSRLHVMVETSGRDIGMYRYIDHLFPEGSGYRKLVVNFTINDIAFAGRSVDDRMLREMAEGQAALAAGDAQAVVRANAGGPYGSSALPGVEADSRRVWGEVVSGEAGIGAEWYKASVEIIAREGADWTARAAGCTDEFAFVHR